MISRARIHAIILSGRRKFHRCLGLNDDPYPTIPMDVHLSPSQRHVLDYQSARLRMAWHKRGRRNVQEWQDEARAKLAEISGYTDMVMIAGTRHEKSRRLKGGLIHRSIYLRAGDAWDIPIHLIFDPNRHGAQPVMLCLQGTNSGIHLSWGGIRLPADPERISRGSANALQAVARGYVAVAIEQSCFGERRERMLARPSPDPCIDAANHALLLGRTLLGERASDVSAVVGWLLKGTHDINIDRSRLHIMGNSSGGTTALTSLALDTRISSGLIGGSVGYFRESIGRRGDGSGQNVIPGILNWMEMDDILSLAAPRPVVIFSGKHDHIWPYSGAESVTNAARAIYTTFGKPENLQCVCADGGHSYHPDVAWPAFEKLLAG